MAGTEVAAAAGTLGRDLPFTFSEAAAPRVIALAHELAVDQVARDIFALRDAGLASADLLVLLEEDTVLGAEVATAVLAKADRLSATAQEEPLDLAAARYRY